MKQIKLNNLRKFDTKNRIKKIRQEYLNSVQMLDVPQAHTGEGTHFSGRSLNTREVLMPNIVKPEQYTLSHLYLEI